MHTFLELAAALPPASPPAISEPVYLPGMYMYILGFLAIAGGGVWDLVQKTNAQHAPTRTGLMYPDQPKAEPLDEQGLSFLCDFADGSRELIRLPGVGKATIGCGSTDDIRTSAETSAVSQVVIKRARTFYYLDVLDSTFPTLLNGQSVTTSRKLGQSDQITVGGTSISIRLSA